MKINFYSLTFFINYVIVIVVIFRHTNFFIYFGGNNMNKGTVKWFNNQKGYGFISDESGKEVFVHYSGLNMVRFKSLEEGSSVEFDIIEGTKGPQAVNVTKL